MHTEEKTVAQSSFWIIHPFNAIYLIVFAFFIALLVAASLLVRGKQEKTKQIVLSAACLVTVAGFFVYKYFLSIDAEFAVANAAMGGFNWWNELPLHLCNINMLLIPIAVWRKNRALMSFSFFVAPLGAMMALAMPSAGFDGYSILLPRMIGFYGTHFMIFIEGIALATFGFYRPEFKDLPRMELTILLITFCVFVINVLFRISGLSPKANYFFAMETEGNPLLEIFHGWIPLPFLYLLPSLVILGVYFSVVTLGFRIADKIKGR